MKKIMLICGARPNFMKIAPVIKAMLRHGGMSHYLVHTGQHYDEKMSGSFFTDLGIPEPDVDLGVGSGTHAVQTAKIMVEFEKVCEREKPDMLVVVGDVNSTMACAIVAKKLWIPVAHIEGGLRSGDMRMPEEINRLVTDSISDLFFTTDPDANANLKREGVSEGRIHFSGNVMIDTLLENVERAERESNILTRLELKPKEYAFLTLHRPSNVDDATVLKGLLGEMEYIQKNVKLVFPVHPRTLGRIDTFGLRPQLDAMKNTIVLEPLGYLDMLQINRNARFALTDSGGLQEETTVFGVPCITLRENTERPVTVEVGSSELAGSDPEKIRNAVDRILAGKWKKSGQPEGWDGKASERIVEAIVGYWGHDQWVESKVTP
jgi:UDP-N-acetylglucosamine 2-epimerase (non-hydrolysing)